jgi:hypothetical protein
VNCRYCGSEDVEVDATVVPFEHPGKPSRDTSTQVMCLSCQAEYIESENGSVLSVYQIPITGNTEIIILTDIPIQELRRIFYEMKLSNEGDEE